MVDLRLFLYTSDIINRKNKETTKINLSQNFLYINFQFKYTMKLKLNNPSFKAGIYALF